MKPITTTELDDLLDFFETTAPALRKTAALLDGLAAKVKTIREVEYDQADLPQVRESVV